MVNVRFECYTREIIKEHLSLQLPEQSHTNTHTQTERTCQYSAGRVSYIQSDAGLSSIKDIKESVWHVPKPHKYLKSVRVAFFIYLFTIFLEGKWRVGLSDGRDK